MSQKFETSEAIVAGINKGDREAETAMVEKFGRGLLYVLEKRTGDKERAKDIYQEALLIVLQKLRNEPLSDPSKLAAYLHSTAINLHIGQVRKEIRQNTTTDTDLMETISLGSDNQYQALVEERAGEAISRLIDELNNERDRRILLLYYIQDNDKEEVCKELNLSHRHFDRVISRARLRFRELVEDRQDEIPLETIA